MIERDNFLPQKTQDPYKSTQYFSQFPRAAPSSYTKLIDNTYKKTKEKIWDFYTEGKFKKNNFYSEDDYSNLQLESIADRQAHLNARIDRDMQETWALLTQIRSNLGNGLQKNNELLEDLERWKCDDVTKNARNCTWQAQKNRDFGNLEDFERIQNEVMERRMEDYAMLGVAGKDARRKFLGDNFQEHFLGEGEVYKEFLYKKKIYDDIVHGQDLHYMPEEFMLHKKLYGDKERDKYQRAEVMEFKPADKRVNFVENNGKKIYVKENISGPLNHDIEKVEFNFCGFEINTDETLSNNERKIKEDYCESPSFRSENPDQEELSLRGENMILYEKPKENPLKKRKKSVQSHFSGFVQNPSSRLKTEKSDGNNEIFRLQTAEVHYPVLLNPIETEESIKEQSKNIKNLVLISRKKSEFDNDENSYNDSEVNEVVKDDLKKIENIEFEKIEQRGERNVTFEVEVARFIEPNTGLTERTKSQLTLNEGFNIIQKTLHIEKNESESEVDKKSEKNEKSTIPDKKLKFVKREPKLVVDVNCFKDENETYLDEDEIRRKNDQLECNIFEFKERKSEENKVRFRPNVDQIVREMEKDGVFTPRIGKFEKKNFQKNEGNMTKREVEIAEMLALEQERDRLKKKIAEFDHKKVEERKKRRELDRKMATVKPPSTPAILQNTQNQEPMIKTQKIKFVKKNQNFAEKTQKKPQIVQDYKFDFSAVDLSKIQPTKHFMTIKSLANENNIYAVEYMEKERKSIFSEEDSEENKTTKEKFYTEDQLKKYLISVENSSKKSKESQKNFEVDLRPNIKIEDLTKIPSIQKIETPQITQQNRTKDIKLEFNYLKTFESPRQKKSMELGSIEKNYKENSNNPRKHLDFTEEPFNPQTGCSSRQSNIKLSLKNRSSRMTEKTEGSRLFNYTITDGDRRESLNNQSLTFIVDPFEIEEKGGEDQKEMNEEEIFVENFERDFKSLEKLGEVLEDRESIETCDHEGLMGELGRANSGLDFLN